MMMLDDYLDTAMRQPWQWGQMDCCAFAGGWIVAATGIDPFESWRGSYRSSGAAKRALYRAGGLLQAVRDAMRGGGFQECEDERHGDICVMLHQAARDDMRVAGGSVLIRYSHFWVARALNGIAGLDVPPEKIVARWRVLA
jgi:hypothetical protein